MTIKPIKFAQMPVEDEDRALGFYTQKLGFVVETDTPYSEGCRWIELEIPGAETQIVFVKATAEARGVTRGLVFTVDDLDATYDGLLAKGVEFTQKPEAAPWAPGRRFALCKDTESNVLMLGTE